MTAPYNLAGTTVLVTGSTSGIGFATAQLFQQCGSKVIVHGLDAGECAKTAAQIPGSVGLACDLGDPASRAGLCERVEREVAGKLDFLIHNAGIYPRNDIVGQSLDEYIKVMNVNVESCYDLTRRLLPCLKKSNRASIVFLSSVVTRLGRGDSPAYVASKAAQLGLARHLAAELGPSGIRVNSVLPGNVNTPGTRAARAKPDDFETFARERQMLNFVAQPIDIAHPIVFLCTEGAKVITAASIDVNAGLRVGG
ncbi:MAG: SDR family NAD(P)-dependent oxidoreductase [Planctomycetota bacterium]|nr:SDR family NAD(P)-dependent oxidoreductase [Planctomycetota bacterium]